MTDNSPTSLPPATSTAQPVKPPKKPRSKVELAIVWGGILVLLVLVGVQGRAYLGYKQSLAPLQAAVKAADESDKTLTKSEVQKMLKGSYNPHAGKQELGMRADTYTWQGVFKSYAIKVSYGIQGKGEGAEEEVLDIQGY